MLCWQGVHLTWSRLCNIYSSSYWCFFMWIIILPDVYLIFILLFFLHFKLWCLFSLLTELLEVICIQKIPDWISADEPALIMFCDFSLPLQNLEIFHDSCFSYFFCIIIHDHSYMLTSAVNIASLNNFKIYHIFSKDSASFFSHMTSIKVYPVSACCNVKFYGRHR